VRGLLRQEPHRGASPPRPGGGAAPGPPPALREKEDAGPRPCLWMAPAALLATGLLGAAPARAAGQGPAGRDREIVTGGAGPGLEHLDRAVLAVMRHKGTPGATLAIAKDGKLVLARGYGLANTRTGQPVRPTSLFNLASCSKPITAAAVLKLVDDGELRLDD